MTAGHVLKCRPDHLLPWSVWHPPTWRTWKGDVTVYVCEYVYLIPFSCHLTLIFSKYLDKCKENIELSQKCRIINQVSQTNELFGPFGGLNSPNCRNEKSWWYRGCLILVWLSLSQFCVYSSLPMSKIALEAYSHSIMWEAPDCSHHPLITDWEARLGSLGPGRWRPPRLGTLMMTDSPNMCVSQKWLSLIRPKLWWHLRHMVTAVKSDAASYSEGLGDSVLCFKRVMDVGKQEPKRGVRVKPSRMSEMTRYTHPLQRLSRVGKPQSSVPLSQHKILVPHSPQNLKVNQQ